MILNPFEIAIVPFPFSDYLNQTKFRPALVLSNEKYNKETGCTIFAMITSAKHSKFWGDCLIANYKTTNLENDCIVRMKIFSLDNSLIKTRIGFVDGNDAVSISKNLSNILPKIN